MKITDESAQASPVPESGYSYVWDCKKTGLSGFGIRVTAAGARSWVARYRVGSKQRIQTIAPVAALSVAKARKKAGELIAGSKVGIDAMGEAQQRKNEVSALTFKQLAQRYLDHQQKRVERGAIRLKTFAGMETNLLTLAKPLHKHSAASISRAVIAEWKDRIANERGPRMADIAGSHVAAAFDFALLRGLLDRANPAAALPKASEAKPRARVLSDAEIKAIWHTAKPDTEFGQIVRLLLLTGCRRDEIGAMRSGEVDLDARWFVLPEDRVKNKREHWVYLTPVARSIIAPKMNRDRLFGADPDGVGYSGWSRSKARFDKASGTSGWTLHDIRRTVATRMNEIGIAPHVADAALGHVGAFRSGVAGTYNRYDYRREAREAWVRWAWHLRAIVR